MIEPIAQHNLDEVLPLIRQYQEFYQVQSIDDVRNKEFFSQFGEFSDKGCQFGYRQNGKLVAFSTVYFSYASTMTSKVAILSDLYTMSDYRRLGIGKALIEHCAKYGKSHGAARLQWVTAPSNNIAQSLYRSIGAKQSFWELFTYTPRN